MTLTLPERNRRAILIRNSRMTAQQLTDIGKAGAAAKWAAMTPEMRRAHGAMLKKARAAASARRAAEAKEA